MFGSENAGKTQGFFEWNEQGLERCQSRSSQLGCPRGNQMAHFMDVQTTSILGQGILTSKSTRKPGIGKNWGLPGAGRPFLSCLSERA